MWFYLQAFFFFVGFIVVAAAILVWIETRRDKD